MNIVVECDLKKALWIEENCCCTHDNHTGIDIASAVTGAHCIYLCVSSSFHYTQTPFASFTTARQLYVLQQIQMCRLLWTHVTGAPKYLIIYSIFGKHAIL